MCTRVVINKSIQYKINKFALCNGSCKQHRIVKMVSRYFKIRMEPGVLRSIAVIVHASVQLLVEINFKK